MYLEQDHCFRNNYFLLILIRFNIFNYKYLYITHIFRFSAYLKPYLDQVSHISNYTLTTQWKYQLPFVADLRQIRDNSPMSRHYALSESSLPHIITAIEKNLGSGITDKTPINLVVYITPCDIAPVYIYNKQNQKAARDNINAFISSKWGGVIIANPSMETCKEYNANPNQKVSFFVDTNDVMQIMLYQLQKLLDISVEVTSNTFKYHIICFFNTYISLNR